jgi:outer membrane protein OmpA-like peptidoglycan-associated protein
MNMKKVLLLNFIVTAGLGIVDASNHYVNRWAIGGGYGASDPRRPDPAFKEEYEDGRITTGLIQYGLSRDLSLVASYANILVEKKDVNRTVLELEPMLLSVKYHPFTKAPLVPYLKLGAGVSANRMEVPTNLNDIRWNKFAAQGGIGLELFVNPGFSIGVEGLYHHFVATPDESPYRLVSAMGMVSVYFGEDSATKKLRSERNESQEEAARLKAEKEQLAAEAQTAQVTADSAQQSAAAAEKARLDAERQAALLQGQVQQAQAEMEEMKNMIARKDISPVKFASGSDKLLVDSYPSLDKVAATAQKYPALKLRVEGHTDSMGDDASNLKLSQQRAEAVRAYLVTKSVPAEKIEAVGLGETKPVADNKTGEGRAQNRRVEFIFSVNQ